MPWSVVDNIFIYEQETVVIEETLELLFLMFLFL